MAATMLISFASAKQLLLGFVENKREVVLSWNVEAECNHSLLDTSKFSEMALWDSHKVS